MPMLTSCITLPFEKELIHQLSPDGNRRSDLRLSVADGQPPGHHAHLAGRRRVGKYHFVPFAELELGSNCGWKHEPAAAVETRRLRFHFGSLP